MRTKELKLAERLFRLGSIPTSFRLGDLRITTNQAVGELI